MNRVTDFGYGGMGHRSHPQGTWGQQGAAQPLGGSNVSELAEEAEHAKGLSFLLTGASAQGEGTPDAKSWGTRRLKGWRVFFYLAVMFAAAKLQIVPLHT